MNSYTIETRPAGGRGAWAPRGKGHLGNSAKEALTKEPVHPNTNFEYRVTLEHTNPQIFVYVPGYWMDVT